MKAAVAAHAKIINRLLDKGNLKRSDIPKYKIESEVCGEPLVEVLLRHDVFSQEDAAQAYADLFGLRFLDLHRRKPARGWVLSLPENVARLRKCLVFGEVGGNMIVTVADPGDTATFAELSGRFDRPIQYVVSPEYQILQTQDEYLRRSEEEGIASVGYQAFFRFNDYRFQYGYEYDRTA